MSDIRLYFKSMQDLYESTDRSLGPVLQAFRWTNKDKFLGTNYGNSPKFPITVKELRNFIYAHDRYVSVGIIKLLSSHRDDFVIKGKKTSEVSLAECMRREDAVTVKYIVQKILDTDLDKADNDELKKILSLFTPVLITIEEDKSIPKEYRSEMPENWDNINIFARYDFKVYTAEQAREIMG